MTANDYCRDKAAPAGSSLHYSLLFLAPPQRQAITALHAFRQEIGGIVEKCVDVEPTRAKLAWWRMEIGALYEQRPDHPITQALAEAIRHFPIAQEHLQEIVNGFEADLDHGGYDDFKSLELYCHRVSSMINIMSAEILGYDNRLTLKFAHELGLCLQLGDIVRDAGRHARQGRIYVPLADLRQFDLTEDDIFNARHGDRTKALFAFQTRRVREHHDKAFSLLPAEDRKNQRALLAMAAMQRTLLDEIEHDDYRVLEHGLSLTPLRKLWIATRTWWFA